MDSPTLETERLILRPLEIEDAPTIQRLLPHWNVVKYLATVPWPYPDDGAADFLSNMMLPAMADGSVVAWALTIKDEGPELIGQLDYRIERGDKIVGSRGFWLGEAYWGKGYMTEAVAASMDYVFSERGFDLITAENAVDNDKSSKIKHRTIGRRVDVRVDDFVSGRRKCEFWEITKDDWLASKNL